MCIKQKLIDKDESSFRHVLGCKVYTEFITNRYPSRTLCTTIAIKDNNNKPYISFCLYVILYNEVEGLRYYNNMYEV